jgi:hypothetical protein
VKERGKGGSGESRILRYLLNTVVFVDVSASSTLTPDPSPVPGEGSGVEEDFFKPAVLR